MTAQRLSAILKSGLKVRLSGLAPGRATLLIRPMARIVARTTLTVPHSGAVTKTITLSAAGRRALHRVKTAKLTSTAGGATTTAKLKR